jgi:hypothetical protein
MTLPIHVSLSLGAAVAPQAVLPAGWQFARVLHECELPPERRTTPPKMPQVRPLFPNHFSVFDRPWQMLSWKHNPLLSGANMTAVYNDHLIIANDHGFGNTPRRNYFLLEDLDAALQLMVEDLTCGGNVLRVLGEIMFKTTAGKVPCFIVETLDCSRPVTYEWLKQRPWLITEFTKLDPYGNPARFPQGKQSDGYQPGVRHPLVANPGTYPTIVIEQWRVVPWTLPHLPDPLQVYNRWIG